MATRELKDANQKATEADYGVVKLAADGDTTAGEVVQGDDARLTAGADLAAHIADTSAAHAASAISFSATGGLSSTNAQAAIAELDTEKAAASHTHTASQVTDFAEAVDDRAAALLIEGAGIDLAYNDGAGLLTISADIPALTADASPDGAADYVMTYDASASAHKKVLLDDLPGGGGGGASDAVDVTYDPTASGLASTNVQDVIDELAAMGGGSGGGGGSSLPMVAAGDIFYVTGQSIGDIALGKSGTALPNSSGGFAALVDGNTSSFWSTVGVGGSPARAEFDAGDEFEIDSFAILQYSGSGQYYATAIKMQGSHDGMTWFDIPDSDVSPTTSTSLQTFTFDPVTYRYFALDVLTDGGTPAAGTGLEQWSVYSTNALVIQRLAAATSAGKVLTSTLVGSAYLPRWA